jgi:autotransporter family porin
VPRHGRAIGRLTRWGWPVGGAALLAALATLAIVTFGHGARPAPATAAPGTSLTPDPSAPGSQPSSPSPSPSSRSSSGSPRTSAAPDAGGAPARFTTLPPGTALPSGTQCATRVRARPYPENKGVNRGANQTTGHGLGSSFFSGDDPRANSRIAARVDGRFTGTTREILRWAACKWGVDEDLVLAQAAIESWWRQDTHGDWTSDASRCPPGHGLGADGRAGQCPESFGILQNRYPYEKSGWPGIATSTAMNADLGYALWRTCFEGYEGWLNTVERGRQYAAGDAWGCVGRWFSGRWHVSAGEQYVARVKGYVDQRIWETPNFQQP